MNETEEFIEESASLEEQLKLELCWYKGEEATNQGPCTSVRYPLLSQVAKYSSNLALSHANECSAMQDMLSMQNDPV